jgi:hypothetical protein
MSAKKTTKKVAKKAAKKATNSKPELVNDQHLDCLTATEAATTQSEWSRGHQQGYESALERDPLLRAKRELDRVRQEYESAKVSERELVVSKEILEANIEVATAVTRRLKLKVQCAEAEALKHFK